jgi:hypothetical protein
MTVVHEELELLLAHLGPTFSVASMGGTDRVLVVICRGDEVK